MIRVPSLAALSAVIVLSTILSAPAGAGTPVSDVPAAASTAVSTAVSTAASVPANVQAAAVTAGGLGSGQLFDVAPARLVDTRPGRSTVDGQFNGDGQFAGQRVVQVTGRGGVPTSGVGAVVLNVTATGSQRTGHTTVYPGGSFRPNASNLNFAPGVTIPNSVVAKVGVDGTINVYNSSPVDLIIDVSGWFPKVSDYTGLEPARLADTRAGRDTVDGLDAGLGAFSGNRSLQVAGRGGVPADGVGSAVLNVTVVARKSSGYTTVYPSGGSRPNSSNVNFSGGDTVANSVFAKVGSDGKIMLYNSSGTDVIVDVVGWLPKTADYRGGTPARLVDTRPARATIDGQENGRGAFVGSRSFKVAGRAGVPTDAFAVVLNVTVVAPVGGGYSTVFASGTSRPDTSNLNFAKGRTASNLVVTKLGSDGKVAVFNLHTAHVVIDVAGWLPQGVSFTQVSAGGNHTCGVTATGGAECWGSNTFGQLGDGTTINSSKPVGVSGMGSSVASISAGTNHTCAVMVSGEARCWGSNTSGQIGNGDTDVESGQLTPVTVTDMSSGVASISAGANHTCAITTSGEAKCWGSNDLGQIGDGSSSPRLTPVSVTGLPTGVTSISAGSTHSCAVMAEAAKCWGYNNRGQLGDGTTSLSTTPVNVNGLGERVSSISVGGSHSCAVIDGAARCWGLNDHGQLGDGTQSDGWIPSPVLGLGSGVASISAGGATSCALTTTGQTKCWGDNFLGQLGDGLPFDSSEPVEPMYLGSQVSSVSAGGNHTCVVAEHDLLRCWGSNGSGQLGDATLANRLSPVYVKPGG